MGGRLRHRFEQQDQFTVRSDGNPGETRDTLVLQRFRLDPDLNHPDNWKCFVQLQDARPFGTIFSKE